MPGGNSGAAIIALLAICVLFVVPMPGRAQLISIPPGLSCTRADLDADIQFINGPGDDYAIVIDRRNVSEHTCVVSTPFAPGFVPDRAPGQPPISFCFECQNNSPSGPNAPLAIDPGWVVREKVSWKTTPLGGTGPCVQPRWISGDVMIDLPSLLKRVCSVVDLSPLMLIAPSDQASTEGHDFDLRSDKSAYYAGEWFPLRLSVNGPRTPPLEDGCPVLYRKQRSPDGTVRFDEVAPLAFQGCRRFTPGHQRGNWQSGFELDYDATDPGEHTMQVFRLANSAADGRLDFDSSNVLRIRVDNPLTIQRKWGPSVKGVAADITLDKDTYQVGEDVPLHLALENFDAPVPVYGMDPLWDPDMVARVEVRDPAGRPLVPDQFIPDYFIHTGHGAGTMPYLKGVVVPMEWSLKREAGLPNRPGAYEIVLTWVPLDAPGGPGLRLSPGPTHDYAVVQAVATIHIVSNDTSQPK